MSSPVTLVRGSTLVAPLAFDGLASNGLVLSAALAAESAYMLADFEVAVQFDVAPAANTAFSMWLLGEVDGTNYEDGGVAVTPARAPDRTFGLNAVTGVQRVMQKGVLLPVGGFKVLLKNDGTGQTTKSPGTNTLKFKAFTVQL